MPKHQTSEISLKTSDLMLKHQKWQHWCYVPGRTHTMAVLHHPGKASPQSAQPTL